MFIWKGLPILTIIFGLVLPWICELNQMGMGNILCGVSGYTDTVPIKASLFV